MFNNEALKYKTAQAEGIRAIECLRDAVGHLEALTGVMLAADNQNSYLQDIHAYIGRIERLTQAAGEDMQQALQAAKIQAQQMKQKGNPKQRQSNGGLIVGKIDANKLPPTAKNIQQP